MPATPTTPKTPAAQTPNASTPQKTGFKPRPGLRLIPPLISIPIFMILLAGGSWLFLDARDKLDKLAQPPGNNTGNPEETGEYPEEKDPAPEDYGNSTSHHRAAQRLASMLNTKVNPCDDFYEYSCGKWLKDNPIPDDLKIYDFIRQIHYEIEGEMDKLLQSSVPSSSKAIEKMRLLYKSCLDENAYLAENLQRNIDIMKSYGHFPMIDGPFTDKMMDDAMFRMEFLAKVVQAPAKESYGIKLFLMTNDYDWKNSANRILTFKPAAPPLYRDVWLDKMKFKKEQDAYRRYLKSMLKTYAHDAQRTISGDLDKQIDDLFELYARMAKIMIPPGDNHDMAAQYNVELFSNLVERFKSKTKMDLRWMFTNTRDGPEYLAFIKDPNLMVNIPFPRVVDEVAQLFNDISTATLVNVQMISVLLGNAYNYPEKYRNFQLELDKAVWGVKAKIPRWKICIEVTAKMKDAYSALYVRNQFSRETAIKTGELVADLKSSFNEIIDEAGWMDKKTRQAAKKKVKEMLVKIGYDSHLNNDKKLDEIYKNVKIKPGMKFLDMDTEVWKNIPLQENKLFFSPFDRNEHVEVEAATVNAFALRIFNTIIMPAGYLRSPLFDKDNLAALNYGSIGTVIGHEITHHFDSMGQFFDEVGLLNDWWTPSTRKEFERRAQCMIDQYSAVEVEGLNGIKVNGKMTLGENIADNGGVREAFRAYQKYLAKNGREKLAPGYKLSNEQLFWIGFGQTWCVNYREGALKHWSLTDDHSPGKSRINVAVGNQPEFAKAFKCPKGSPMNPKKKCSVW